MKTAPIFKVEDGSKGWTLQLVTLTRPSWSFTLTAHSGPAWQQPPGPCRRAKLTPVPTHRKPIPKRRSACLSIPTRSKERYMESTMDIEIERQDVAAFLDHLKAERDHEAGSVKNNDQDNIRAEHLDRVEAADRLLASVESHRPGQPLTLTADDRPQRFILAMTTDRMLRQTAEAVGRVCRDDIEDHDAIEAAADRAVQWSRIARQVNLHDDQATAAERLQAIANTEGVS